MKLLSLGECQCVAAGLDANPFIITVGLVGISIFIIGLWPTDLQVISVLI